MAIWYPSQDTSIVAGDILFYKKKPNDIFDSAIVAVTGSDYVHVAVALNHVQKIEELSGGVVINPIDISAVASVWSFVNELPAYNALHLHNALNWLLSQKGNAYGWGDIANVMLEHLRSPVQLATNNLMFCSALAAEFLMRAGFVFEAPDGVLNIHDITPSLLAQYLDVK